jgi:gamma-glutamyltranspeptidase/glutathione hydrolase
MFFLTRIVFTLLLLLPAAFPRAEQPNLPPIITYDARFQPIPSREGMVVSSEATASRVGAEILAAGGNAIDAAVATGFALAVTYPQAGNIGGGGFLLAHLAADQRTIAIDYRETAPQAATRDMFLDAKGEVVEGRSSMSHLASGVPGTVAGLLLAHQRYGKLPRARVMAPAIALAEQGIPVSFSMSALLKGPWGKRLLANETARGYLYKPGGAAYEPGEILRQKDLAWTLRQISQHGVRGFYAGPVAEKLVAEMQRGGGLITHADLRAYRAVEREPVRGRFHDYEIISMPPPSSGGVHLVQMLNVLEGFPLQEMKHNSAAYLHVLTETMKRAYADRSKYLGDPDFVEVPIAGLTSRVYAKQIHQAIDLQRATPAAQIAPVEELPRESTQTTHFSVMDREGNVVSNTYTLNYSFGNGVAVPGAGFFMNNEMDDFSAKPGVPNAFGLVGEEANAVGPAKRPLSSMTPTLVMKDGKPWPVTGAPGGARIITVVLQLVHNTTVFEMNIADATAQPRAHHQWLPDELYLEPGISADTAALLVSMGHVLGDGTALLGNSQSLMYRDGSMLGASDTRRPGGAVATVEQIRWAEAAQAR